MQDDRHDCQDPQPELKPELKPEPMPGLPGGRRREKLGLALAGGGFRASLFHVGVLRYLARADLLRYVEVLSTVSGGSLVGALYVLQLKQALEAQDLEAQATETQAREPLSLSREAYLTLIDEVEARIRALVSQNLRMRLLLNVGQWVGIVLGVASLGKHFARYLDRQLFAAVNTALLQQSRAREDGGRDCHEDFIAGTVDGREPRLSLRALRLCAERVDAHGGTENYNRAALWDRPQGTGPASAVTRLILNTTSLNSSGRFWFSHAEFGEWYMGYVRHADIRADLWPRKWLLLEARSLVADPADPANAAKVGKLLAALSRAWRKEFRMAAMPDEAAVLASMRDRWPLLRWWRGDDETLHWPRLQALEAWLKTCRQASAGTAVRTVSRLATLLRDIEMGRARQLKNFAWLLLVGRQGLKGIPVRDGMSDRQLAVGFVEALKAVDDSWLAALGLAEDPTCILRGGGTQDREALAPWADALLQLVIEIYQCRCAEFMSPHVWRDWQDMPLSEAVAASASFPPVFPPHVLTTLVDDRKIRALGLTDGGVFDNLGSTALLDEQCTMIIASDPGGVFDTRAREVSVGRIGLMGRLVELLSERPNQLFRHELRERRRMGESFEGSRSGPLPAAASQFVDARALTALSTFRIAPTVELHSRGSRGQLLSAVRTDLDVFGPLEQDALIQQGERQAERHLQRRFAPGAGRPLVVTQHALSDAPELTPRQQEILAAARHRFWRLPRLFPGTCLLLLALLMASAWHWPWPAALASAALVAAEGFWQGLSCLPRGLGLLNAEHLARLWSLVLAWQGLPLMALPALPLAWLSLKRQLRRRARADRPGRRHRPPGGRRLLGHSWATWRRWMRRSRGPAMHLTLWLLLLPGVLSPLWLVLPLLIALGLSGIGLLALFSTRLYMRVAL